MRSRIIAALGTGLFGILGIVATSTVAEALQCVSQDISVDCHRTIQAALSAALPSEGVDIYPGTYPENIVIGTPGLQVIGRGAWAGEVVIKPPAGTVVSMDAAQVRLENVTIVGGEVAVAVTGDSVTIDGVRVLYSNKGISVSSTGVVVKHSLVRQVEGTGIEASGSSFSVHSSVVQDIGGQCISIAGDGALVQNNRIIDCGAGGVRIDGGTATVLDNHLLVAAGALIYIRGTAARVHKNTLKGGKNSAVTLFSDSPTVTRNSASDCATGIDVFCEPCSGGIVAGNSAQDIYDCPGFEIRASSPGMVVENNVAMHNAYEGFSLLGKGMAVRHNKALRNVVDGILISSGSSDMLLEANTSNANAMYGIRIEADVTGTKVKRNRAHHNGALDFYDAGTGTLLGRGVNGNSFGSLGGP